MPVLTPNPEDGDLQPIGQIIAEQVRLNQRGRRKARAESLFWEGLLSRCHPAVTGRHRRLFPPMPNQEDPR